MSAVAETFRPAGRSSQAAVERELRVQLAAAYRMVDHFGWTELIYGHLTMRLPREKPTFLINPYGLNYDEVTASNLVEVDVDGNKVCASDYPVNRAGFVIHSSVHMAGTVNKCVMHTHTRAGMALSACAGGLKQVHMYSTGFYEDVGYHEYEGPSLDTGERERLLAALGAHSALILRNHGILTVGRTIAEAFIRLYRLERACQVQLDAAAADKLHLIPDAVAARSREQTREFLELESKDDMGGLEFRALMRKLDRVDPSYRD